MSTLLFRSSIAACLAAALFWGPSAEAAGLEDAFPTDAVATFVNGDGVKLVVVEAGDASDSRSEAAAALSASLKAADKVKLVLPDDSLGDVDALDDAAIVDKAGSLPVELIVIVRVIDGDEPTAIVTMYSKEGETMGGFTAAPGAPVEPQAGAGSAADAAVGAVMADAGSDKKEAIEKFLQDVVWFEGGSWVSSDSGAVVGTFTNAYKGRYKEPLYGRAFYEHIGSEQGLADYDAARKKHLIISSAVTGVSALGLGIAIGMEVNKDFISALEPGGARFGTKVGMEIGFGTTLIVGAMMFTTTNHDPYASPEKRRLADEYNQKLMDELGITKSDLESLSARHEPTPVFTDVRLVPWTTPEGFGAGFTGRFW